MWGFYMFIMKNNTDKNNSIIIKGARTHNLKNISLEMPRNKMVVITGVSGSGKSSLAFDTIFAEGQRRYVESLSAYARQFLNQMPKPDVDEISGLSPAISIDQKSRSNNPRSTVATITEVYDYLRVLYSRVGRPHCPNCGDEIKKLSNEEIVNFVLAKIAEFKTPALSRRGQGVVVKKNNKRSVLGVEWDETPVSVFSPVVRGRKGEYYQLLYDLLNKGFSKVRMDGEMRNLRERIDIKKTKTHNIEVLVDSFAIHEFRDSPEDARMRLSEAVERGLIESDGLVQIIIGTEEFLISSKFSCPRDGFSFPEIEPRLFSFNSPYGACATCNGLGTKYFGGTEVCDVCLGARLRTEALHVFLGASKTKKLNIVNATALSIKQAHEYFETLELSEQEAEISKVVIKEIMARLEFLLNVGS
jgi:excinuclease ABC subunit A